MAASSSPPRRGGQTEETRDEGETGTRSSRFVIMLEEPLVLGVIDDGKRRSSHARTQVRNRQKLYGVTHPSEPNSVAANIGLNWGVNEDPADEYLPTT